MQAELKQQIVAAALSYIAEKNISINQLAEKSKINAAYLSNMLKGNSTIMLKDKPVAISDKWFVALAETIGYKITKAYWKLIATPQLSEIIAGLETAKETAKTQTLIGPTGCGKTYAIDLFCRKHPLHTYKITVSALYKLPDIINEMLDRLGLEERGSKASRLARIIAKLQEIKRNGGKAILIIDEAENLELPVIKMLKALYDGVKDYCAIVLVGTTQLTDKLVKLKKRNKDAVPQFYRRFKAGIRMLSGIDGAFNKFFDDMGIVERGLRQLLTELCENYGELNDYLEPALREADLRGEPLTEDIFRIFYNLPKLK